MNEILVCAPNAATFWLFLRSRSTTEDIDQYQYVKNFQDITLANWKPIVLVNGGSRDAHIRNLCNHPSRQGIITRVEVLYPVSLRGK